MSFFERALNNIRNKSKFTKHFKEFGEKPKYLENISKTTSMTPFIAVFIVLPFVITPLIKKRSILKEQETGDGKLNILSSKIKKKK